MAVNWKPFRTLFLCTWLGKFAKPTKPISFLRMIGEVLMSLDVVGREGLEPFIWLPFGVRDASPLPVEARSDVAHLQVGKGWKARKNCPWSRTLLLFAID